MSTYGKLNLLTIKSTYLVFSSRERQRRPIQIKVYYKLFYSVWKETSHKPLKVTTAKNNFPSMYIIDKTCFNLCFLFHVVTGRHYFLRKFGSNQRFGAIAMLLRSLTQVFWNRSAFYVRYLRSNTSVLPFNAANTKGPLLKFYQKENFFLIAFLLHSFILWISTFFFINEIFKTQKLSGGIFFIKNFNQIFMALSVSTNCL